MDQRVDVYSLGATLYELLVQQPAREGDNREEMRQQFATTLPTPLRKIDSKTPAELATIVGKAMELEPTDRYTTARDLADDLGRFLTNQPIEARPPTRVQRVAKWAQRNQAVTWSAAVSSVVVLILAVALLVINNMVATNERNRKDEALRDAEAALVETEATLRIATQVLNSETEW